MSQQDARRELFIPKRVSNLRDSADAVLLRPRSVRAPSSFATAQHALQRTQGQVLSIEKSNDQAAKDDDYQWTDPVPNPTYRGFISPNNWAPEKNMFGAGVRNNNGSPRDHQGVDLAAKVGQPVRAVMHGNITSCASIKGYGRTVAVRFINKNHETRYALYAHLSKYNVKEGQKVRSGDVVGFAGTDGYNANETEHHLHFGIRKHWDWSGGDTLDSTWEDPALYMHIRTPLRGGQRP